MIALFDAIIAEQQEENEAVCQAFDQLTGSGVEPSAAVQQVAQKFGFTARAVRWVLYFRRSDRLT